MDYIRGTYKAKMKLWKDDDTETEVLWFIPEPNAIIYTELCSFRSRHTWQRGEDVKGVGEVTGLRYPYSVGQNTHDYPGDHFCGSQDAFFGGGDHFRDEPITTEADGTTPCCFPPPPPPPPAYVSCDPQTGYTDIGATLTLSADVFAVGRVAFLIVHRTGQLVLGATLSGWSVVFDQTFTPPTDPFFTGKHRVTIYRRVCQGGDAGSTLSYPATPTDPGTFGAFFFSVTPTSVVLKQTATSQAIAGTLTLPTLTAADGDLLVGRWMALSNGSYSSPSAGSPSPVCFVTANVGAGQTWNPHVGIRDRTIEEVVPAGVTPARSIHLSTSFGDSVVIMSALFG